jgi:mRNA-degrading endonuclease RelE of RelBE toxin-antitoxin system
VFEIDFDDEAVEELKQLRVAEQARILDEIERHLAHEPLEETRRRKPLKGLVPDFEHEPPIWELRVGEIRVFYDVDSRARVVQVRAVRIKGRRTTKEIT